jgi:hypothetical protein
MLVIDVTNNRTFTLTIAVVVPDRLSTTTYTKEYIQFQNPLRVPSHPHPLLLVPHEQRCNHRGSHGRPPGTVSNSMAFVPQIWVETTCWWHCFPVTFSYFSQCTDSTKKKKCMHRPWQIQVSRKNAAVLKITPWAYQCTVLSMYRTQSKSSCAEADSLVKNYYRNISQNINKNYKLLSRSANPNGAPRDSAACARRLWMDEWKKEWMNEWMNEWICKTT